MTDENAAEILPDANGASTTPPGPPQDIVSITLEEEMKRSYLDYAMSVIVSRALPDVRDGLKPVHRRILYAMKAGGFDSTKPYKKSAKIVGEVMGNFHPHGDTAIYDAMVRMAQPFSMSLPLIDGQGNFGSMDDDPPAAMRYTEARLAKTAEALLQDIDSETVDFRPNYDESQHEPVVLPARYPNLLVNGAGGIAVGMATNIPPHNLGEVIDACVAYVADNNITIDELMNIVPGPDFPTGGQILGRAGIRSAYNTGRGSVVMRAKSHIEDLRKDRQAIIIDEVPYQVNKADIQARVKELVNDKLLEGISDMRDESNRLGVRVVFELKREAQADIVQNNLFKATAFQTSFGVNMLALNNGQPRMMNLKDIIVAFVAFREEVITKRTIFQLGKARDRAHILIGLAVAVANIDEVIKLIRAAPDGNTAKEQLMARPWPAVDLAPLIAVAGGTGGQFDGTNYKMSEAQAKAILELRLQRLTGLEREKISDELREVAENIKELLHILANREKMLGILVDELQEIKTKFAVPRRTEILDVEFEADIEDLIPREEMVVTISNAGYAKRVPLDTYRAQGRGGKGRAGMSTKEEDFVTDLFVANTHQWILFFTTKGMAYRLKVYKLPVGNPQARGKALVNLLPLQQDERISAVLPMPLDEKSWNDLDIIFATSLGHVRRNKLADFDSIRASGLIAMKLDDGENLIGVHTAKPEDDIMLSTALGRAIRFSVDDIRVFAGRNSNGVRGIKLSAKDEIISLSILHGIIASADERAAYLKARRAANDNGDDETVRDESDVDDEAEISTNLTLSPSRMSQLEIAEEYVLTVTSKGFGKLTSAYEYRTSGRAGQGITNLKNAEKVGEVVATFPVQPTDQVMLATDGGTLIRLPLSSVRITGRATSGVILLRVSDGEKVVSAVRIEGDDGEAEIMEAPVSA